MRLAVAALIVAIAIGCSSPKSVKPLAGMWQTEKEQDGTKGVLLLAKDNSFIIIAANDFAFAGMDGTYEQTADTLTLHSKVLGSKTPTTPIVIHYRWIDADTISIYDDSNSSKHESTMKRYGVAPATATPESVAAGAAVSPEVRERTESVSCLSNLKQLGMAVQMYAQDWDNTLPMPLAWKEHLMPYSRADAVFTCPAVKKSNGSGGYAFNMDIGGVKPESMQTPEAIMMIFETASLGFDVAESTGSLLAAPRHDGKVNVLYADAHVKAQQK